MAAQIDEGKATKFVSWLSQKAFNGVGPLSSAESLAQEYLIDKSYPDNDARVDSLINWETSKNFTAGFVTGLGGLLTLPVSIPSALGAAWVIQARMTGAISIIYGHSLKEDRVKTLVILCLLGDAGKEVLKQAGIKATTRAAEKVLERIPGKVLIEINKKVGFRLLTKAGEKGVVNLTKLIPGLGGVIGGAIDAAACRTVGKVAKNMFRR